MTMPRALVVMCMSIGPCLLAGCGDVSKAADAPTGYASPTDTQPSPAPSVDPTSAREAKPAASATLGAFPADVTKAGFPFKPGVYTSKSCDPNSGGLVEFMREGLHYWEADQATSFEKVLKLDAGKYRITEQFDTEEGEGDSADVDYQFIGPKSFKRTEHVTWDDTGKKVKRDSSQTYTYCRPIETP